jgi:DNA polymerase-3 subunit epsilon
MLNSFVSIDFETANRFRASVCEIGAIKVIDGVLVESLEGRFRPPSDIDYFEDMNIAVHGIKPEDVENEPAFYEYLDEVDDFIDGLPMVAHNASFEKSVFGKTEEYLNFSTMRTFECTLQLARKKLPYLTNHKLPTIVKHLDIDFDKANYHGALYDAELAAKVYLAL